MWARIVEFMLACWLMISPFIFRYSSEDTLFWANDLICATLIASFSLFSFWKPLRKLHLFTLAVAFWLWGRGYINFPLPPSIVQENSVVLGLLFFMLALVPTRSEELSPSWKEFERQRRKEPMRRNR